MNLVTLAIVTLAIVTLARICSCHQSLKNIGTMIKTKLSLLPNADCYLLIVVCQLLFVNCCLPIAVC